jgi:peptidoglycan/xylan/chitin deacetylase (PgdA/CDA1 family)
MTQRSFDNRPPGLAAGRYLGRLSKAFPGRNWSRASREFWPDGAKLVISIALQFEAGQSDTSLFAAGNSHPNALASNSYEYGAKEGIPRLLDVFRRRHVRTTVPTTRSAAERDPHLAREIVERGHEAAAILSCQTASSAEEERRSQEATIQSIQHATGFRPIGVKANCRPDPRDLQRFHELGFLYHSDDASRDEPFLIPIHGTALVVIPDSVITDDAAAYESRLFSSDQYASELKNQFEMIYSESEARRRMMSVTVRDYICGQPARAKVLEEFIIYAQRRPGVVFMRKDDIARFVLSSSITPREEEWKKDREAA